MNVSAGKMNVSEKKLIVSRGGDDLVYTLQTLGYTEKNAQRVIIIRDIIEFDVFGRAEIKKLLRISESTAARLIEQMKKDTLIVSVSGHGKGKYRFITEEDETE